NVLQGLTPARLVEDSIEIGGKRGCTSTDQHLATSGERRDPRGQIDGRAEIVAFILERWPVMEAYSDGRRSMVEHEVLGDPETKDDPVSRIRDPQHERVPNRLDVFSLH